MAWKIEQHKRGDSSIEIQVAILVKEMKDYQVSHSQDWIDEFKKRLKEIPSKNASSAENSYKATLRNETSLEVWKMKANGDFNYKMFTVTKI